MVLFSINVESNGDLSDAQKAEEVESRARSRVAELSQRPFDVRSIALTGLFILAMFYTIYFMRSILLPIAAPVTAPAVCFRIGGTWISSDDCELPFFFRFG